MGQSSHLTAHVALQVRPLVVMLPAHGTPGAHVLLAGFGFGPTEAVRAYWIPGYQGLGAASTSALGATLISLTVPLSQTGLYHIVAVGQSSKAIAVSAFVVTPAVTSTPTAAPLAASGLTHSAGTPGSSAVVYEADRRSN